MQTALTFLVVLLGVLALPLAAGAVYQAIGTLRDRRRFLPPGRLVQVNERQMLALGRSWPYPAFAFVPV